MLTIGQKAPAITLPDQKGFTHKLSQYLGGWVLIYFYPADMTPGCTAQACSIRDVMKDLKKMKLTILGISTDSIESHQKFAKQEKLNFPILSDNKRKIVTVYGVLKDETAKRAQRMSFLIDPKGKIAKVYEKVIPAKHAVQVMKDLLILQKMTPTPIAKKSTSKKNPA